MFYLSVLWFYVVLPVVIHFYRFRIPYDQTNLYLHTYSNEIVLIYMSSVMECGAVLGFTGPVDVTTFL